MELFDRKQDILLRKIWKRKEEIKGYILSEVTPVTDIVYRETTAYETLEEGLRGDDFKPIKVGDHWGGGKNAWFKVRFKFPEKWAGKNVAAFFEFGGEACAFIDGKPFQGVDRHHEELMLPTVAKGGEEYEVVFDVISGQPWDTEGEFPGVNNPTKVHRAEIALKNIDVYNFWWNLEVLYLLAENLPGNSPRRAKIINILNSGVDAFDYDNLDCESLNASALRADEILKPLLEAQADESALNLAMVGHSHIDVAWKWPYRETMRKCSRTFSTVMRMMEQYPDYVFSQGQAQLYEYVREKYPTLYEEIKARIKDGMWDVTGSMWVEADCNLSSGESLIRQVLLGKNFFKDELGVESDVLWLPDVFGYSAALPQILKKAGVNYFATNKINWSEFNRFPYSTFYWKGIDGTRVLAHFPPTSNYNGYPEPKSVITFANEFRDKDIADDVLFTFGWGDGGGGPDRRHMEFVRRSKSLEGLPKFSIKSVPEFFHGIDNGTAYAEWVGELYLEYHRGTYTTQAKNKLLNRRSEFLFRDAELLSTLAVPTGLAYPYEDLNYQWKQILCNQFHDVIPGTSVKEVYNDTDKMYDEIISVGEDAANKALAAIASDIDTSGEGKAVVVFNSLGWERAEQVSVELPGTGDWSVLDSSGNTLTSQAAKGGIAFTAVVPAMGYAVYRLIGKAASVTENGITATDRSLENRYYKIEFDDNGQIKSLIHKETGREVIADGTVGNLFQLLEDKPLVWPAWDIEFFADDKITDLVNADSVKLVENGALSATLETEREFSKSKIKQKIIIYADNPRIDFDTWVDWHENEKCLKVAFPIEVNSTNARYEIQFGNVERPTHANTSWDFAKFEVCAHKWADLSEEGFGVSLLNDCKYGHQTKGNVMKLTLLRSAKRPDKTADMGEHRFTYSLIPHSGSYVEAQTVRRSYELNIPMRTFIAESSDGTLPAVKSFISVDASNAILETVKKAEKEDATIMRFYECHNSRSTVNVSVDIPFNEVYECNLMEDNITRIDRTRDGFSFSIKPFEIKTFKLVR